MSAFQEALVQKNFEQIEQSYQRAKEYVHKTAKAAMALKKTMQVEYPRLSDKLFDSAVIRNYRMKANLIRLVTSFRIQRVGLLYRATRDGFDAKKFHELCDDQGVTLTVAKSSSGRIFGAFTDIAWQSPEKPTNKMGDGNTFLFSFDAEKKLHRLNCLDKSKEVCHYPDFLPVFGGQFLALNEGNNFSLSETASNAYELPELCRDQDEAARNSFIAGFERFKLAQLEVFKLVGINFAKIKSD